MIKYSVIIPTWGKLDEYLKPCLKSIAENTSEELLGQLEVIVVSNGSKDGTEEYLTRMHFARPDDDPLKNSGLQIKMIAFPEPIGYTRAVNCGIKEAKGEFLILMNNDCQILPYKDKNVWLQMLEAPFLLNDKIGVTGPSKLFSKETQRAFAVFFLVMIKKSLFDELGLLDETFNPGGGEDIDFCMRAEKAGYKIVKVPKDDDTWEYGTDYPIYHKAEGTVFDVPDWEDKFALRMEILRRRTQKFMYAKFADVTATISTKGRYDTTLASAIISVANQTLKPKKFILFQDDPQAFDLRQSSVFMHAIKLLENKGIQWSVVFGEGKGQVANHQKALEIADTEWIWRLDDDNFAEPNVLQSLCASISDDIGAIAGCVTEPGFQSSMPTSTKISDIGNTGNYQWVIPDNKNVIEADHLYSSFLYRKAAGAHGYCKELSIVGHREETIFTHEMKRAGWKLAINPNAITWHFRESKGGIRDFSDHNLWAKDEQIFQNKLKEWGVTRVQTRYVNLNCGLGDHWAFRKILDKMLEKFPNDKIVIASCYDEVFSDVQKERVELISIADATNLLGQQRMDELNVYGFCMMNNWNKPLQQAYEEIYLK